jgi:hypothetical protein
MSERGCTLCNLFVSPRGAGKAFTRWFDTLESTHPYEGGGGMSASVTMCHLSMHTREPPCSTPPEWGSDAHGSATNVWTRHSNNHRSNAGAAIA